MAEKTRGNAVIGQSGGPTAVINQSLVGVIQEARKHGHIDQLLGARHGVRGIVNDDFIELNDVPDELLERIANTPAAALGSTRDKPDAAYCEQHLRQLQEERRPLLLLHRRQRLGRHRAHRQRAGEAAKATTCSVFHIPKTIDNDLRVHDHTPGYGVGGASSSRRRSWATTSTTRSLPGIKVDVIMGRNAGFLTAASVLARQHEDDGPHLIYVPEAPVSEEKFLADVDRVYTKHGRCLIAVSEGISQPGRQDVGRDAAPSDQEQRRARQHAALRHRRAGRLPRRT